MFVTPVEGHLRAFLKLKAKVIEKSGEREIEERGLVKFVVFRFTKLSNGTTLIFLESVKKKRFRLCLEKSPPALQLLFPLQMLEQ